jgi:Holliday junction DNA helicase RuvB
MDQPVKIVEQLSGMAHGDYAFFDECHRLSLPAQELLFEVIDNNTVPAGSPGNASSEPIKIAPITMLFATDKPGELLNALLKRIPATVRFAPYPDDEMREIVHRIAARLNILISPQAAGQLVKACHGIPRRAEHHMQMLRLHFKDAEERQLGRPQVCAYLRAHGISKDGLGQYERRYLLFLAANGSASLGSLAGYFGIDAQFVRDQIEQPLRHRGLVAIGSAGRVLTQPGKRWVEQRRQLRKSHRRTGRG